MSSPSLAGRDDGPTIPILFQYGFRFFFLFSGVAAVGLLGAWLGVLVTGEWPDHAVGASAWHAHEMLFGTVVAAVAGFLLTAVPSWTGTKAVSGAPLMALAALWIAGRVAVFPWTGMPEPVAAVIDLAFLPGLGVALARPLVAAGKWRNSAFLILIALLTAGNLLIHLEWLDLLDGGAEAGFALGLGIVLMMVTVIGGRILPAFTRNGLGKAGLGVRSWPMVERPVLVLTLTLVPATMAAPDSVVTGLIALAAAVAHTVRLAGWQGWKAWRSPILWILHVGYLWVPMALLLRGLHALAGLPAAAGTHALTVGAFATLILAVMSRASLGHTGRPLVVSRSTVAAYVLLTVAAVARTASPLLPVEWVWSALQCSGYAWVAAFTLYLVAYAPVLLSPRADGRPG
ncbi:NnrS family protein [Azospirillum sp. YIM B02556]|uniref:NnrS family protein n=1 Tax=Azospirillum endophyticum TaxID=2800326 RepID=A0ABS1F4A2_9PROT|nr:NnrS family protein [Azospirillum endophyticum]MBK1838216.1 NnrS family protein [Azospirillum endophyticum]